MFLSIDSNADGHTDEPMIRQRLWPQRVNLKGGGLDPGGLYGGPSLENGGTDRQRDD
jgi:hypothetical protein